MRRIASVLSSKRPDNTPDDGQLTPSSTSTPPRRKASRRFFGTLNRITVSTEPPLTRPSEPTHSSSASSTGSVSLRTPEDDRVGHLNPHGGRSPSRKAWIPWLTPKKLDLQTQSPRPPSFWSDSLSSVPSPIAPPTPSRIPPHQPIESDDETSEESSSSESEVPPRPLFPAPARSGSDSTNRPLTPIGFLTALTTNSIQPLFSPPPLLHYPNVPLFPRSSNGSRSLPFRDTIESTMHRKRLLHRLQQGHLTPADQRLLVTFGPRAPSVAQRRTLVQPEEGERYDLKHVRASSLGLKQWVVRPYFEERSMVSVPDEAGTVVWTTIKGSGFGVWALEVSETLELMAGLTDAEESLPIAIGTPAATAPINLPVPSPSMAPMGKIVPYKAEPSPLRGGRRPSDPPVSSSSETMTPASTVAVSSSKRGVRFAENVDKEDQVPLGYILRHRKRREERALFIQRQQTHREHEEERLRHEAERQQWEKEKRQWQKEKRALEEAKRQKQYTEEILAARARREGLHALPSSQPREQDRKFHEAYSRPSYDPRRQVEPPSRPRSPYARNDSSSSSRRGSLLQPENASPLTERPYSAPSVASSEDVRARINRNNRRASVISESSQPPVSYPVFTYGWPPVPPMPQMLPIPAFSPVQAMPMMPQFPMDMPLLPPAAPFMRQQYDRSRSPDSSRGIVQSRSAERPPASTDRSSTPSHRRSSSDEYGGRKSTPPSHPQRPQSSNLTPARPAYPMHTGSPAASQRTSTPPSSHRKPYAARRQMTIS